MIPLNLHHLYYFWVAAREGSVAKAGRKLLLTQPAVSVQIIQLEKSLGKKLFERKNKRLHLTPDGTMVLDYADAIFNASQELMDALRDRPTQERLAIQIGVVDQVPKRTILALTKEIVMFRPDAEMTVLEGTLESLLTELQTHQLDLVVSDTDVPIHQAGAHIKAEIGTLPVHFVAAPRLARRIKIFPRDLSAAPLILPVRTSPIRGDIERYLNRHHIEPKIIAEVQDVELARLLALDGQGIAPLNEASIEQDLKSGTLKRLGRQATGITEPIWLITRKRHQSHPIAERLRKTFRLA